MKNLIKLPFIVLSAFLVGIWAASAPAQAPPPPVGYNDIQKAVFKKANERFGIYSGNVIEVNNAGIINEIKTIYMNTDLVASDPIERAYQFFERNIDLFQIPDPRKELAVKDIIRKEDGTGVILFDQVVGAVKVYEGGCSIYFSRDKTGIQLTRFDCEGLMGLLPDAYKINLIPTIDSLKAGQIAQGNSANVKNTADVSYLGLWIANDYWHGIRQFPDKRTHLVWHLFANCAEYFIDAHTGEVLYSGPICFQ